MVGGAGGEEGERHQQSLAAAGRPGLSLRHLRHGAPFAPEQVCRATCGPCGGDRCGAKGGGGPGGPCAARSQDVGGRWRWGPSSICLRLRVLFRRGSGAQVGGHRQGTEVRVEGLARSLPAAVERHSPHAVIFVPAGGVVREETLEHCCRYHCEPEARCWSGGVR